MTDKTSQDELVRKIAQITRTLRDGIRELGLDKAVEVASADMPVARDRLRYIGEMNEAAANRVLSACEQIQPIHDQIVQQSAALHEKWRGQGPHDIDLHSQTEQFLAQIPHEMGRSHRWLMDIVLAQGFQDLTGQVIIRLLDVIDRLERDLVHVLAANHADVIGPQNNDLMQGPQIEPARAVSQAQADKLLQSFRA